MIGKQHWSKNLQKTKDDIGRQFHELRRKKRLTLNDISEQMNLNPKIIERIELGMFVNMEYNHIHCMAKFYDQKIIMTFEDEVYER